MKEKDRPVERKAHLDQIAVVLQRPRYAGNVGSVARCMKNMGLKRLIVSEGGPFDREAMVMMSTHFASDIVDGIVYSSGLREALADFQYVVGMTARLGAARGPASSPREMAERLVDLSQNNRIALLFGSEDKGLSNADLRLCHAVVTIPVSNELRSLNLSHAVMVMCYEIFTAAVTARRDFSPKLATSYEIEGMYDQLKVVLAEIGFLNPQNPDYWMMHLRRLFSRTGLHARDVKIIRGICRQIRWAVRHGAKG